MKHGELRSIAHNLADSLASGVCLMIGVYDLRVFEEARLAADGAMRVDFLAGSVVEGEASWGLREAVRAYRRVLPDFCARHGGALDDFRELTVRYWSVLEGPRFSVTVEDAAGRRSTTVYGGLPGQRLKLLDGQGRLRPKPVVRSETRFEA